MFADFMLLFQVIDFVVKACQEFAGTEAGKKELNDILSAEANLSGNAQDSSTGTVSPVANAIFQTLDEARAALQNKKQG